MNSRFSETPRPSERNTHVERRLTHAMEKYGVPAVGIAVMDRHSLVWSGAYGVLQAGQVDPAHPDSLFQACSISKAVTAVAALRLIQEGVLDLDADVNDSLKTWKVPSNDSWQPAVTIRQLLSHIAGVNVPWFYGYHREQNIPTLEEILAGEKPANTPGIRVSILPGTRFRYSGGGYCVLQQLLCDVCRQSFPDLMSDLVLTPLRMNHSTYQQPLPASDWSSACSGHRANGTPLAGGWHIFPEMAAAGLWTTATDLARFSMDLQFALAGQTDRLLSPETVGLLLSPQAPLDRSNFMGLGIRLDGSGATARFGHPGDNEGFGCLWTALREGGRGAVIMTNSDRGGELIADVLQAIERAYDWPQVESLPGPSLPVRRPVTSYTGTYRFESGGVCTISQVGGRLTLELSPQRPVPLTAIAETAYLLQPLEGEVIFLVNSEGAVDKLLLRQDGAELSADKLP